MQEIANYLDTGLIVLFAATIALVLYKFLDLWFPRVLGKRSFERISLDGGPEVAYDVKVRGLYSLGTIASVAPFLGLTGTVMHIIEALQSMEQAAVDISLISGPLATAMYSTVWGLASAIPATIGYNMMVPRLVSALERGLRQRSTKGSE